MIKRRTRIQSGIIVNLALALISAFLYIGCGDESASPTAEEVSEFSSSDEKTDKSSASLKPMSSSSLQLYDSTLISSSSAPVDTNVTTDAASSVREPADSSNSSSSGLSSSSILLSSSGDLFWGSGVAGAGGFTPYWYYDSTKFKPLDPSKADGCFQIYQDSLVGTYFSSFEEPLCVVKQTILGLVEKLVNQGVAVEEAKATAMQKLYDFLEIDVAPKNDSLYESAIGYAISTLFLVDNGDTTMRVKFINDLANGKDFSKSDKCGPVVNSPMRIRVPFYSDNTIRGTTSVIIAKLWRFCGGLENCDESNRGELKKYDCGEEFPDCGYQNREYICTEAGWNLPTTQDYETRGHECKVNNTRVPSDSIPGMEYICYEGKWFKSNENLIGKLPKEYFFNEEIEYGTMKDPRDDKVYKTIVYDGQTWMAENIDYYTEDDPTIRNYSKCSQSIKCDYGRFYNVEAALKACPEGWRLPKKEELQKWIDIEYTERQKFLPKLFSKLSGVRKASDDFGLSVLSTITVDPYGWDETSGYGVFWVEGRSYIRFTDSVIYFDDYIDMRENGQFMPVRCIQE